MKLELETDRLLLRILTPEDADKVLAFYNANAPIFEKYEPIPESGFYELSYHKKLLEYEMKEFLKLHLIRFWIFDKTDTSRIIGTVSFHSITDDMNTPVVVGYKMDQSFWRQGYCYEALNFSLGFLKKEIGIRHLEAFVLPDNAPSIGLLKKLRFQRVEPVKMWKVHDRYRLDLL